MKMKRHLSILLCAAMVLTGSLPLYAQAEEADASIQASYNKEVHTETTDVKEELFLDLPENDELFAAYVDSLFFGDPSVSLYGNHGEGKLEGVNRKAYDVFKEKLHKIALGEEADTRFSLSMEDLGIEKRVFTAEELGVSQILIQDGNLTQEVMDALMAQLRPNLNQVLDYLLMDCPWDLYWYDKTKGVLSQSRIGYLGRELAEQEESNHLTGEVTRSAVSYPAIEVTAFETEYSFTVAFEYRESQSAPYRVNASLAQSAKTASDNAKNIVEAKAALNDYEKLTAYKNEICDLTSYNHSAVEQNPPYGNPWQLIWVFDGNPDTEVVCEGYAKAFQYLCDMSAFRSPHTACYTVTGVMGGGTGSGGHMWNIVTMKDQKNYIVDVTNCDEGAAGAPDQLFLAGATGSAANGYITSITQDGLEIARIAYGYGEDMPAMYGDILNIAETSYEYHPDQEEDCPNHLAEPVEAKPATCTEDGVKAHFICRACHKYYSDALGTNEITQADTVEPALGHAYGTDWEHDETKHYYSCARCDARSDEAEHGFAWVTDVEPTETTVGHRYEACTVCGFRRAEEEIPALGAHEHVYGNEYQKDAQHHWQICTECNEASEKEEHRFGEWEVKEEGSCTEERTESRKCLVCQYEETKTSGLRHTLTEVQKEEATCQKAGHEAYWECSGCHQLFRDGEGREATDLQALEIARLPHDTEKTDETEPSCTQDGNIEYYVCGMCQKYFTDALGANEITQADTVKPALGHAYGTDWEQDETKHYHSCVRCDARSDEAEHSFAWVTDIEPTETTAGHRYEACTVCGFKGAEEELPALGAHEHVYGNEYQKDAQHHWQICTECDEASEKEEHRFSEWEVKEEGSCTEERTESRKCLVCQYEETKTSGVRHTLTEVQKEEATCQKAGHEAYWECSGCHQLFRDGEGREATDLQALEIARLPHDTEKTDETEPSCTQDGNMEYYVCGMCQKYFTDAMGTNEITQADTVKPALGHAYGTDWEQDETKHYHSCVRCDARSDEAEHSFVWVTDIEPTEMTAGHRYEACTVCGFKGAEEELPALGAHEHVYGNEYQKDAQHHWQICTECNEASEKEEHRFGEWETVKEPTTAETGLRQRECAVCGFLEEEEIPVLDHNWEEDYTIDLEPSCETEGRRSIHCKDCDEVKDVEVIPATGHSYGGWIVITPQTCTQSGTRSRRCSVCDKEELQIVAAAGHAWEDIYTIDRMPTCTTEGREHISCRACGEVMEEIIPAAGHNMVKTEAKEPSCTSGGNAEYYTCVVCRKLYLDADGEQEVSEADVIGDGAAKHHYETVVTPATTDRDGLVYHRCTLCGSIADSRSISCPKTVTLSAVSYIYSGSAKKPAVTVYDSKGNLIPEQNYTVSYSQNKNVGTATATITFMGDYSGTVTRTFRIKPKGTSVSKLKGVSKGFTVTWKKNQKQTTGYQIQYAVKKNFKGAKVKTYEGVKKATILNLKAGKKYYVRVRTYKTVDGVRIYSGWSKAKTLKTKK